MASPNAIKTLNDKVAAVLTFDRNRLLKREEWGSITFEAANPDYGRIFDIANYLKVLPTDILTDQTVSQIQQALEESRTVFERISKFSLESTGNPKGERDQFVNEIKQRADQLFTIASPWIPFLAYQKGDVQQNITQLNTSVARAAKLIDEAKSHAEERSREIDTIITKAREASAAAGAAVFTSDFIQQAGTLEIRAKKWLIVSSSLAATTLVAALLFYFFIASASTQLEAFQRIAAKLAIIGVLITATVWCGRIYKALMHQSSMYRFKGLGLQTFQAFSAGASNLQVKDAVLMETTRSIFAAPCSGYIDENSGGDTQVIEVLKSALPQNGS